MQSNMLQDHEIEKELLDFFAFASEKSSIDFVLCNECLEHTHTQLKQEYTNLETELERLQSQIEPTPPPSNDKGSKIKTSFVEKHTLDQLEKQVKELEAQESHLSTQLDMLEQTYIKEVENVAKEIQQQEIENQQQEMEYWNQYNDFLLQIGQFVQTKHSYDQHIQILFQEFQKLNTCNMLNDAFHIWFDGFFGTINTFKLGRLNSTSYHPNVEWNEINAALGQCALLLQSLERFFSQPPTKSSHTTSPISSTAPPSQKGFAFTKYRVIPNGSFPKIEQISNNTLMELSGGSGGLFWQSKFEKAMIAFLFCVKELGDYIHSQWDAQFEFPYKIEAEKVGGVSIKISSGDETWTKSCKYLLSNLKWLILFVSSLL